MFLSFYVFIDLFYVFLSSFLLCFFLCCLRAPRVVVIIGPKNQKTTKKSDNLTKIKNIEKTFVRALR